MRPPTHPTSYRAFLRIGFGIAYSGLAILLVLAGCGRAASSSPYPTKPPVTPGGTPFTFATPFVATPASITGWKTYTDSVYHFKTVIPPDWRIETALDNSGGGYNPCNYDAIYFPPGDTHHVDSNSEPIPWYGMTEYMYIRMTLKCPEPSYDSRLQAVGDVTISGAATTVYGRDSSQEVDRITLVKLGGYYFTFALSAGTTGHKAPLPGDVPLYLGVLQGFDYLGGK
jgi:hypothetical protein